MAVADAFIGVGGFGRVIGVKLELSAPGNVAAKPVPFEGREIMGCGRGGGERRVLLGCEKATVLVTLEHHDAIRQDIRCSHSLAEPGRNRAEILADHCAMLATTLQCHKTQQILQRIVYIGALGRLHSVRDPVEPVQRHNMVNSQNPGMAHIGAHAVDKRAKSLIA